MSALITLQSVLSWSLRRITTESVGSMTRTPASLVASISMLLPGAKASAAAAGSLAGSSSGARLTAAESCTSHRCHSGESTDDYSTTDCCCASRTAQRAVWSFSPAMLSAVCILNTNAALPETPTRPQRLNVRGHLIIDLHDLGQPCEG